MSVSVSGSGISRRTVGSRNSCDRVDLDIAPGEHAREQLRHAVTLRHRERARVAALIEPVAPDAAAHRVPHVEEEPAHRPIMRLMYGRASVGAREWRTSAACRSISLLRTAAIAARVLAACRIRASALATCLSRISTSACAAPAQIFRIGRVALRQRCEFLLVLQRRRVGDDRRGLARLADAGNRTDGCRGPSGGPRPRARAAAAPRHACRSQLCASRANHRQLAAFAFWIEKTHNNILK